MQHKDLYAFQSEKSPDVVPELLLALLLDMLCNEHSSFGFWNQSWPVTMSAMSYG